MFSPQGFLSLVFSLGQHPPKYFMFCVSCPQLDCVFFVLVQGTVHVCVVCLSVPTVCGLYFYHLSDVLHSKHIICLTCCTAITTHKKSCVGACSHAVRVMSYERCMLREFL